MASISSVGIGSGVLTSELIDKLAAAEREPAELRLNTKEAEVSTQLSDMGLIKSALSDLRISSRIIGTSEAFESRSALASSTAISVSSEDGATLGTNLIDVTNLAQSRVLSSEDYADTDTTIVGTGTFEITDGTTTAEITIDNSNGTLAGIASAINSVVGLNVTASVINTTGSNFRLMLTSDDTGTANQVEVNVTVDGDGDLADSGIGGGLSQLNYNTPNMNMNLNSEAEDAEFTLNGLTLSRSTNVISDALSGTTLTFLSETSGTPTTISINQDTSAVVSRMEDVIDKYNAFKEIVNEVTAYDPSTQVGGSLLGNSSLSLVDRQIRNTLASYVTTNSTGSIRSLADIGISTDKDTGLLALNTSTFQSALAVRENEVSQLLSAENGTTTDTGVSFVSATDSTANGSYAVNVTRLATQGTYSTNATISNLVIAGASNDTFTLRVDGVDSGTITIDPNTYADSTALATQLQTQIDADATLSAAGVSVTVGTDADGLTFTSGSYGSTSAVEFRSASGTLSADLGLQGVYRTNVDTTNGVLITSDNNTFVIEVDDVRSNTITLDLNSYNTADLAAELESKINADANLMGTNEVTVTADNGFIEIRSNSTGTSSSVDIISADSASGTTFGLIARDGYNGLDVAGTINNATATGSGKLLSGGSNDATEGLVLSVTGTTTGSRGNVTFFRSVGEEMVRVINGFLSSGGAVATSIDGFNQSLATIDEDRQALSKRIDSLTARLARQFTAMDIIISQLKNTEDFVSNQLSLLNGNGD